MNAADLARLDLAKRAFKATQPSAAEVQTGVRRARLAITRVKPHRRWFSKGLVFVVLAVGSLAYAKPQALGELVERVRPREAANADKRSARATASEPVAAALRLGGVAPAGDHARNAAATANTTPAPAEGGPRVNGDAEALSATDAAAHEHRDSRAEPAKDKPPARRNAISAEVPATAPSPITSRSARQTSAAKASAAAASPPVAVVSDWGRVGQALARGDDTEALAALNGLSESDDQRTRDKADIGRAQLLMAHGNLEKACALARSLSHRRAGGRIERQAQLLLKSCGR